MEFVTVFRKINRLARKLIITYTRKWLFEHEDANGNKDKETHFTPRRNVGLASNLDGGIFANLEGTIAIKKNFFLAAVGFPKYGTFGKF